MRNWPNENSDKAPDSSAARAADRRDRRNSRTEGLLESAFASPFQEFASYSPYPTVQQKAARLGYSLVMNHPFIDGNKRIGAHAMLTLLALNGIEIECTQESLAGIFLSVAAGETGYDALLVWLLDHQA